jgi:hypothetical protein
MIVNLGRPGAMDAKIVFDSADATDGKVGQGVMSVQPRRYSKTQRKVNLFPFSIMSDATAGKVLDQGYITLDVKTGKLIIEHRNEEVPVEVEKK